MFEKYFPIIHAKRGLYRSTIPSGESIVPLTSSKLEPLLLLHLSKFQALALIYISISNFFTPRNVFMAVVFPTFSAQHPRYRYLAQLSLVAAAIDPRLFSNLSRGLLVHRVLFTSVCGPICGSER